MIQARRKKTTPGFSLNFNILPYIKRGLQEGGFLLFVGIALYLVVALVTFKADDPGWTHTSLVAEVGNLGGALGAWFADISLYFFGYLAYLLPLTIALCGWRLFKCGALGALDAEVVMFRILGFLVALAGGCGLASLHLGGIPGYLAADAGGIVGGVTGSNLIRAFGFLLGNLFMLSLFLAGTTLATGFSWLQLLDLVGKLTMGSFTGVIRLITWLRDWLAPPLPAAAMAPSAPELREPMLAAPKHPGQSANSPNANGVSGVQTTLVPKKAAARVEPVMNLPAPTAAFIDKPSDEPADDLNELVHESPSTIAKQPEPTRFPAAAPRRYPAAGSMDSPAPLPPLSLLDPPVHGDAGYSPEILEEMSRHLEILLRHYGIEVRVVAVDPGPVITCFEVEPAPGVKVSQISNLAKDLARGLSVVSVRVVEVIPGKSVVGLEIPNQHREIVYLSEVLTAPVYAHSSASLTLALGKDIGGNPVVANLAKMPHLLVAGTTGSGKSVAINAMLLSILYKARPDEVRLILVDPKMLELSVYEGIPHLLTPVVTDMKEAANALRWCVGEMERRYRLMAALKVRNIAGFNLKVSEAEAVGQPILDPLYKPEQDFTEDGGPAELKPLPFIVVVIDELADMMMIVGKKVEELIARLAQKARASGIHLILATQRPSVDVITGLIKANIPTRIAFQVSSRVDSRTILDQMGADQLLGHGDMLYLPPGTGFPRRLHGAFVDDQEVNRVVEYLRQTGKPDYITNVLDGAQEGNIGLPSEEGDGAEGEGDPLYDQAVRVVTETRRASISGVQRRLKIGYNRAARMIEEMESAGIVGPLQSNGSREVLAPPPPEP